MRINEHSVRNFRNIEKIVLQPGPGLNILVGDNAQGKTNLLESIYILATGTSFRSGKDINFLKFEEESYLINCKYSCQDRNLDAVLQYDRDGGKTFLINGRKTKISQENNLKIVLFTPDDLYLIKGAPAKRRNYLDFVLKQVSTEYAMQIDDYNKILQKRNLLLKNKTINKKSFAVINEIFIENAVKLIINRINFVNILNEVCQKVFPVLNDEGATIKIKYALSFPVSGHKINHDILRNFLSQQGEIKKEQELIRCTTMTGPHLDDLNVYINDKLARIFASQGQQRNLAVTLKLAEIYAFKQIKGFYPLFLLDEVLSELDDNKKRMLLESLSSADFQSFLSSVGYDHTDEIKARTFLLQNGCLV